MYSKKLFYNYLLLRMKNVYLIQMFMGLRISEVLALTTHDIDLESRRLRVKRTLTKDELGNTIMGKSTKTYAGKKRIANTRLSIK